MDRKLIISIVIVLVFLGAVMYLASRPQSRASINTLLTVKSTGGLCIYGTCDSRWIIRTNGEYAYIMGDGKEKRGHFSFLEVNDLKSLIDRANFNEIKSKPFTDVCPIAYDGAQYVYHFYTKNVTIDSCVTNIDEDAPLWKRIENLLATTY